MTFVPVSTSRAALLPLLMLAAAHAAEAQHTDSAAAGRGDMGPGHHHHVPADGGTRTSTDMIVPMLRSPMLPALRRARPSTPPFLPGAGVAPADLPAARPHEVVTLADGDTLELEAGLVRRSIAGRTFTMYGFNGQYPGPLLRVTEGATVVVRFRNRLDLPSTVHWHGVRLENRFDGVPDLTQPAVAPGEDFWYRVHFRDGGVFWYHPHVREDIQQELGLYGNIFVRPSDPDAYGPAHREEFLILDDLLADGDSLIPFGKDAPTFAIMGRFGNVLLTNGETRYQLEVRAGEVVRFFLTNASNARTFNVSFGGAPIKLVGSDLGNYEREMMVESVVIAPAERYVVDVHFAEPGRYPLLNQVQAVDVYRGEIYPAVDTLGQVAVGSEQAVPDHRAAFRRLRPNRALAAELKRLRPEFDRPVDHELSLSVDVQGLPILLMQFISIDTIYRPPVEWTDPMADMNWLATGREVRWVLREAGTGRENMDVRWTFRRGELVKLRIRNDPGSFHPMQHPIHLHGQRFLVLEKDGVPNRNFVWKDTVLVPVGSTVDLLMEASNPGWWMLHCHIAEHLQSSMMMVFDVR